MCQKVDVDIVCLFRSLSREKNAIVAMTRQSAKNNVVFRENQKDLMTSKTKRKGKH